MCIKSKWIVRAIVESPFYIGLCLTENQFKNEMKRLRIPAQEWPYWLANKNKAAAVHFFEQLAGHDLCALVCIKEYDKEKDPNIIVGLLIHEAVHIWQHICLELGETNPSSEFEAYSIQAISQRLIAKYSELASIKITKRKGEEEKDDTIHKTILQ
jgi:hypothetical protein